ncbi:MAG: D-glycero-beta-D-manno-heptose 1-phosphate adenylyltransferase [Thermodesulfobacteriota bacterium]
MEEFLSKIKSEAEMRTFIDAAKERAEKVVFTNGCFDILHHGHIHYLSEARTLGDHLIVGLNSDESVRQIKGQGRPLLPQRARAEVLAALCFVDGVVIFNQDSPLALIEYLLPQVLVKGADWSEDEIVGADIVKGLGGTVHRIALVPGISTTEIIRRAANLFPGS